MRADLHATSQGMMCKTPLCNISEPFHPKGVKVFVPRTSPHRWSSPKTIYTTSVSMQTEVQSSLRSGADMGHWFMGRFPTRLEGPGWAPTPCLVFWVMHGDQGLNPSNTMTVLSQTVQTWVRSLQASISSERKDLLPTQAVPKSSTEHLAQVGHRG